MEMARAPRNGAKSQVIQNREVNLLVAEKGADAKKDVKNEG
jgi:hypothetical protein